jgi:hypothetical protein
MNERVMNACERMRVRHAVVGLSVCLSVFWAFRYQPPFEICVCAERHMRDCTGLIDDELKSCVAGIDVVDGDAAAWSYYVGSACDGYFDGAIVMEPLADISGISSCYREP